MQILILRQNLTSIYNYDIEVPKIAIMFADNMNWQILPHNAKMRYMFSIQVSRYCLFEFEGHNKYSNKAKKTSAIF